MSGIGRVLNTAKEALLSQMSAINITGANIANVNTPGYSRLRPVFSSVGVSQNGSEDFQVGVKVADAERIYDKYLEAQLIQQQQNIGYGEAQSSVLERIEGLFNESAGNGLNAAMSEFWNAWQDLAANPSGLVERDVLVSDAQNLASLFRQKADGLLEVQADMNASVADVVTQVNSLVADIAQFNDKISQINSVGGNASDLLDKRAQSMKDLAGLINFNSLEDGKGAVSIFLSNGKPLVEGNITWPLDVAVNPENSNYYDVVFKDSPGNAVNGSIQKGKLAGYLEIRDSTIPDYLDQLNELATSLVNAVNTQHSQGYDSYGNTGANFFNPATGAADMQVSAAIAVDSRKIAASGSVSQDGDNAIQIAKIQDSLLMKGGTATLDSYYSALMGRVGQDAKDASSNAERQSVIMTQLESQREAVSGVSLDEEMLNLIKFQLGYNAAGKLTSTVSEMMDTLMDLVK